MNRAVGCEHFPFLADVIYDIERHSLASASRKTAICKKDQIVVNQALGRECDGIARNLLHVLRHIVPLEKLSEPLKVAAVTPEIGPQFNGLFQKIWLLLNSPELISWVQVVEAAPGVVPEL
jgi:hypothetical protein